MKTALIPWTSTCRGLNRKWFPSQWKDFKCFYISGVENCLFKNAHFWCKRASDEKLCPRTLPTDLEALDVRIPPGLWVSPEGGLN